MFPDPGSRKQAERSYSAGSCNIGKEEVRRRYRIGITGLLIAILTGIVFHFVLSDRSYWKFLIFIPVFYSLSGFIQAMAGFCYFYGLRNMYSMQGTRKFMLVDDTFKRRKDRLRSLQLLFLIAIGSIAITAVFYYLL